MHDLNKLIIKQYFSTNLFDSIKNAVLKMNKNPDSLTIEDLAAVDFFHIRGYHSTKELAGLCNIKPDMRILDVGCGIGGTARFLAEHYKCFVAGLDIIEEYCLTATKLSELLKLENKTEFKTGNGSKPPFGDETFDMVWTEHVQMNIENKNKFFSEIHRVLKKGGKFVFHDVFKGSNDSVLYPVPWADDKSISFLWSRNEIEGMLKSLNFKIEYFADKTEISGEVFRKSADKIKSNGFPPLGLHLLMGKNTSDKIFNMARNLSERRLSVLQCICAK